MAMSEEIGRERWGGLGGLLFVLGMAVIFFGGLELPEDATSEQLVAFYRANEAQATWIPFIAVVVAALGLLWFLGSLRSRLRRSEGGTGRLASMATIAGAGSLVLILAAAAVFISISFAAVDPSDNPNITFDISTHSMVEGVGFGFFIFHIVLGAALAAAASAASIRSAALPAWFGWVGLVLAVVALLVPVLFIFSILAFWVWVVVTSVLLLLGGRVAGGLPPRG